MWGWSQWALVVVGGSALALRARAQPSYLCQCDALLWAPVQQTDPNMTEWHDTLAAEVARNDLIDASRAWRLVLWGDSITMRWRKDWHVDKWGVLPPPEGQGFETPYDVFMSAFGRWRPQSLGVGSDQSANLWWQLRNGLLPQRNRPDVAVVMIGTNDIGFLDACSRWEADDLAAVPGISSRIRHAVALLRRALPRADIVLLGVLPRGGWTLGADVYQWPNRLTAPIAAVNNGTQALARLDDRMHYLDCGAGLINAGGAGVNATMLPGDALHPSAAGYHVVAACLTPVLERIFAARGASPAPPARVLRDVADAYADTCEHPDTTSPAARAFAARMAAAAAVSQESVHAV